MKVLARHYLCFAGQLCGVSTDGTGFTAIVRRICVHVIGVIPASGTAAACKRASRHDDGSSFVVAFHASLKKQARKLPVNGNRRGSENALATVAVASRRQSPHAARHTWTISLWPVAVQVHRAT